MSTKLTAQIIDAAIDGFQAQKSKLDQQIAGLRAMLSATSVEAVKTPQPTPAKRRKFSAAALRRMREAQRQRWARVRGETAAATKRAKPKRRISATGMSNIIAARKRRWALKRQEAAKARKAGASRKKAGVKKATKKVAA